jgi:FtsP/CotA-like multicopper oxidase with cupredoxin domain
LLQAGLALATLALGQRTALGQPGHAHDMPALGVANLPIVPAMDQPLLEPEVRRSLNGMLSTSLRCAYAYRDIGGFRLYLRSYEGGLAPTLRMKPGETLKIRLINDLPPNRDIVPSNPSHPHQFNNTNFHFHGAHCSPSGIADNVMRSMVPGKSYDVEVTLPEDHTRGTYWYHPHHHGSADVQVASGMAGAIIVEGDFADVPEIAQARERVMLLSEVVFDATPWSMTSARSSRKRRRASWRSTDSGGRPSTCGRARCSAGDWSARSTRTTCCWSSTGTG